jgi:two-component system response regulator AtoC
MPHAIVIDDDPGFQEAIAEVLSQEGFSMESATTLAQARQLLGERMPDLALVDLSLPDGDGSQLIPELATMPFTDVVLITGNASVESAIDAFREGVVDYLTKPVELPRLRAVLANISRRRELHDQVEDLRAELRRLGRFGPLIGSSPPMQHLYDMIARVAPTNATVFIQGESGTGKELVAQTVHQLSRRRKQPFVALNCGAVTPQLIESELFGHERGSFTGADRIHKGYFERAHGGTLFLDEITEMPVELQVKLLRS